MQLTSANVISYLIQKSWIDAVPVVSGDAIIVERKLKHRSFSIEHEGGSGVFIKQVCDPSDTARRHLQREAAFYQLLHSGAITSLPDFCAHYIGYDPSNHLLAVSRLNGQSFLEHFIQSKPLAEHHMQAVGVLLARLHTELTDTTFAGRFKAADVEPYWVFNLPTYIAQNPASIKGAAAMMAPAIANLPDLSAMLASVGQWWREQCLIHADLKWENIFMAEASKVNDGGIRLIDWESVCVGDPAWDVATFLQAGLARICLARESSTGLTHQETQQFRSLFQAFWQSWVETAQLSEARLAEERIRVAAFGAARLVQSAYEHASISSSMTPAIYAMLSTSWEMLRNRHHAEQLLGLNA